MEKVKEIYQEKHKGGHVEFSSEMLLITRMSAFSCSFLMTPLGQYEIR